MIIIKILLIFIFYIIIFLLGILLILVMSPIKGSIKTKNNYLELKGQYLFGLLKFNYRKIDKTGNTKIKILFFNVKSKKNTTDDKNTNIESNKADSKDKKSNKNDSKDKKKFVIPSKTVIIHLLHTLKKIVIKVAPTNAYGHFIIGVDDPYYNVIIQMISQILFLPLNNLDEYNFTVETDFLELKLEYDVQAKINFSIFQLIAPLMSLILKKPIRQYLKKIKKSKKNKNKKGPKIKNEPFI